jgi:hypothetical protein
MDIQQIITRPITTPEKAALSILTEMQMALDQRS